MSDYEARVAEALDEAALEKIYEPCTTCGGDKFAPAFWRPCSEWPDCGEDCVLCYYEPCPDCRGTGYMPKEGRF